MSNKFESFLTTTLSQSDLISSFSLISSEEFPSFIGYCAAKNLPLERWSDLAIALYDMGRIKDFLDLMKFLIDEQMEKPIYSDESSITKKISLLNALSVYYLSLAACENDKTKKEELFATARSYMNKCDKINVNESSTFALKGWHFFFQGDFSQSLFYFGQNSNYGVAILGRAILEFASKKYDESLKLYKKALRLSPQLPPQARLGCAYNFLCLEKYGLAMYTFKRILKLDPKNTDALIGLAILEFKMDNYNGYYDYIEQAWQLDNNSPFLLLLVAENLQIKGELEKAKSVAIKGYNLLKNLPRIVLSPADRKKRRNDHFDAKSRFLYILGYYYHVNGKYETAAKYYELSTQAFPQNLAAQYGKGQICIYQKNFTKALKCFELINESSGERNEESLKILGYLCSKNNKRQEAIEYYEQALKYDNSDYESWIEYAALQEQFDLKQALFAYEKALAVLSELAIEIKPEIHNNIGVLKMKLERYDDALDSFTMALEISLASEEIRAENGSAKYLQYTIMFNMGVLYEESKKLREASDCYKKILSLNPFYSDALLRLAYMAFRRGSYPKALEYLETAVKKIEQVKKVRPDLVFCLKGYIFQEIGDFTNAKLFYETIKKKYSLEDPFADLAIMKMFYEDSCELRNEPNEQKKYLKILIEMSKHVLSYEEVNYQAALMLGVVMAEFSHFSEAKEIFNQIEFKQQNLNILLNIAHLEYLKGNFENAIKIYESSLQKALYPDEYIEMCLVLNNYLLKKYDEAIRVMKKLVLKNPENLIHRYNLNVLLHDVSLSILEQKSRQKDQTVRAITNLNKILPIYEYLYKGHYARKTREDIERCDDSKRKMHKLMEKLRDFSDNKYNFIKTHQNRFEGYLREDEELIQRKKFSLDERKKIFQEMKERDLRERKIKEQEDLKLKIERERIAQEEMELAQKLAEDYRRIAEENEIKKQSRQKKNKDGGKNKKKTKEEEYEEDREEINREEEGDQEEEELLFTGDASDHEKKADRMEELEKLGQARLKSGKKRKLEDFSGEEEEFIEKKPKKRLKLIKNKHSDSEESEVKEPVYDPLTAGNKIDEEIEDDFNVPDEKSNQEIKKEGNNEKIFEEEENML